MSRRQYSFLWMLLPFLILFSLAASMIIERSGVDYEIRYPPMEFLPQESISRLEDDALIHSQTLVLFDSEGFSGMEHFDTVLDALDSMRVTYDTHDINSNDIYDLTDYDAVIVAFIEISKIENKIIELIDWVEGGGRVLFSIRPDPSTTFTAIYRKLGIISIGSGFVKVRGVEFVSNILPGVSGLNFGTDFIFHNSFPVSLEEESKLHAVSAEGFRTPLIWDYGFGNGQIVFINSDQFNTKSSRGIIGSAYSLLFDVFAYPVINASMFYIDDFPGPIPEGSNELITEQFGRDIQSFYINEWWPDVQQLSIKYNMFFTGVMLETYNDNVTPPFDKQPEIERHQYFGGLVLDNGGELGFHGYNHVPLCYEKDNINQVLDYPYWPSTESMELAIFELYSFAKSLFPDNDYVTYVPPSNILCSHARQLLPQLLPELKVISSLYLEGEAGLAYEQEFTEAPDGIVELPRIITGYEINSYMWWAAINELGLHYVNSHFVHPYDVLKDELGVENGWSYLRDKFEEYLIWLTEAAPGLRPMTSQEGAMAVQRFNRITLDSTKTNDTYVISLGNFHDEAWLMLRTGETPLFVDGGTISQVSSDFYLVKALESEIIIGFME